jgi:flagellar hook-basal body complex protein FliE
MPEEKKKNFRINNNRKRASDSPENVSQENFDDTLDKVVNLLKKAAEDLSSIKKNAEEEIKSEDEYKEALERSSASTEKLIDYLKAHDSSPRNYDALRDLINKTEKRNIEIRAGLSAVNTLNKKLQEEYLYKNRREYNTHILNNAYTAEVDPITGQIIPVYNDYSRKKAAALDNFNQKFSENLTKGLQNALKNVFNDVNNAVNSTMTKYAEYQSKINTRLQGTALTFQKAEQRLTQAIGVQPYFKTQSTLDNLQNLVGQGIAFNVEQRAFLETISEKIATTFDVANASLLRIVRLQQQDSTAARLGMEAALTSYLNQMFEDTSYLNNQFDTVQGALLEASSLMTTKSSVAFEYQVQKWLGSLSSLGMSESTITSLGQALGYLGSGNISGLAGTNMQNLLAIAANRAGLSYGSLITSGLNESTTNVLLRSIVEYLQEIAVSTNNAAKSEIAQQFGVTISDLVASLSMSSNILDNLSSKSMSYNQDILELSRQLGQVAGRTSVAGMVDTMYDNVFFSLASSIASNPVLAATWKITDLIQKYTGGINIPTQEIGNLTYGSKTGTISGTAANSALQGVVELADPEYDTSWIDMETTVENLMKLGIIGIGTLSSIGDIVSGLSSTLIPSTMLAKMGISSSIVSRKGLESISTGTGLESLISGLGTSMSTYVGTTGSALYDSTMAAVEDLKAETVGSSKPAPEKQDERVEQQLDHLNSLDSTVKLIYNIMDRWDSGEIPSFNTGSTGA